MIELNALSWAHLLTGTLAVCSGFTALLAPKGRRVHRLAGCLFVPSMVLMALSGSLMALLKPMPIASMAGLATLYLVLSAWLTVHPRGQNPRWIRLLCLAAAAIALACMALGLMRTGTQAVPYYFFGVLVALAGALDLRQLIKGPAQGRHRLARHLWRMCLALFIAAGSLFTGPGAVIFPAAWRNSGWMSLPENLTLLIMLAWLLGLAWAGLRQRRRRQVGPSVTPVGQR
ncbi:MAG: hypothetical protein ACK4S6_14000 [Roseateles asaccharophilus]|uniref:Uncharacterized protein n=1 Tax=Roseateles asaccharophilus TaxID=582607 RepID=A0A4R6NAW3_9BURK|nr:hypothetical protein [Roseateles asaccharophilus]MDN3546652.1 hypothetical protein [Roseateles asaccharophilus]TDP12876.1 hypothetical protein DFR39_101350 [Roseateles asaccharophilus]